MCYCAVAWLAVATIVDVLTLVLGATKFRRVYYQNPSLQKIRIISSAFEIYHALKIGLRHELPCLSGKRLTAMGSQGGCGRKQPFPLVAWFSLS